MEGILFAGANPISPDTIERRAEQYVMAHKYFGRRHKNAYIAGANYILGLLRRDGIVTG